MQFVCHRHILAAAAVLLLSSSISGSSVTTALPPANSLPATCEARTINYITDSLPQQCGKSAWSNANATAAVADSGSSTKQEQESQSVASPIASADTPRNITADGTASQEATPVPVTTSQVTDAAVETPTTEPESGELDDAEFLSFEQWKKQELEKLGQQNANIGNKKSGEKRKDSDSVQNNLESYGEEGELDLDFSAFTGGGNGADKVQASGSKVTEELESVSQENGRRDGQYRSKDAGKTCKERFSYASFDAGATIVKANPEAKNTKAILIENKDSYMLVECNVKNKFLIIELSEDIWIDTLVLANYEFFSSMIRTFRVSVSDRYPVKAEKWKDLGVHEARNSREIQAFLIENPQIWARYLRIEFLSHYGNEYYCPLSLVRVHGTRMLESWKETEAIGEEEGSDDEESIVPEAIADVIQEQARLIAEQKELDMATQTLTKSAEGVVAPDDFQAAQTATPSSEAVTKTDISPWVEPPLLELPPLFNLSAALEFCAIEDAPVTTHRATLPTTDVQPDCNSTFQTARATSAVHTSIDSPPPTSLSSSSQSEETRLAEKSNSTTSSTTSSSSSNSSGTTSQAQESPVSSATSTANKPISVTSSTKSKSSSTSSGSSALPTIQESFFKAVSRRLQLLESNSTLSLKYIEEQSKMLREAFSKVEKKQLQKTNTFLETLNTTVLAELRGFRQQYDEIWQSTVISLESQREESRREILAISARLTILADEVVFQKRMSIIQSVLLLLCLGLVIFSRVSAAGHFEIPIQNLQSRARAFGFPLSPLLESPPASPEYMRRATPRTQHNQWLDPEDDRLDGGETLYQEEEEQPPTPLSSYSRSDPALTPPSAGDDPSSSYHPHRPNTARTDSSTWDELERSDSQDPALLSASSSSRTPRKRKVFVRQQQSPPPSGTDDNDDEPESPESVRTGYARSSPAGKSTAESSVARKPLPALPAVDDDEE